MTIATQQPIGLSQFTPFLCHAGSRVGYFSDPPGPSVVVEGGIFEGTEYSGVVLTPTAASSGAIRVDLVVANPNASGGPAIVLVAGTEGEGAPEISDYPGAAKVAEVRVTGNANGSVIIPQSEILDLRPILEVPRPGFKLLFVGRVRLGEGQQTVVGSTELLGDDTYPYTEVLAVKRSKKSKSVSELEGHRLDWVDLEMPYYVEDFHLVGSPYDTMIGVNTPNQKSHSGVGITWKHLTSETQDDDGRDLPLVRIAAMGASGKNTGSREYYTGDQGARRKHAFWQFQAWGRV